MIRNLLLAFIPILGLILGYLLRKIAQEEVEPGKNYLTSLRKMILFAMVIVLVYNAEISILNMVLFLIGVATARMIRIRYIYIGIATAASLQFDMEMMILLIALASIYGLPFGTQMIKKDAIKTIIKNAVLYGLPFLLLLTHLSNNNLISIFAAGTLFLRE